MDLEDRGQPDLAHRFVNGYLEATGDYGMLTLLPFYLIYRATVRAKIAGIRLGQSDLAPEEAAQVRQAFGSYLDLAERYTRPSRPRLWITHGLSGSGKTSYTQRLVEATGAIRLRSDVERKRLFGVAPLERSTGHRALDLYAPDATQRTYTHLAQQAARVIEAGYTAVVDATFLKRAQRDAFRRLAVQLGVPFTILAFRAAPRDAAAPGGLAQRAGRRCLGGRPRGPERTVLGARTPDGRRARRRPHHRYRCPAGSPTPARYRPSYGGGAITRHNVYRLCSMAWGRGRSRAGLGEDIMSV